MVKKENNYQFNTKNKETNTSYLTIYETIEVLGKLPFYLYEFILLKNKFQEIENFDYSVIIFPKDTNLSKHYTELNILTDEEKKLLYTCLNEKSVEEIKEKLLESIVTFKSESLMTVPNSVIEFASYLLGNVEESDELLELSYGTGDFIRNSAANKKYQSCVGVESDLLTAIVAEIELLLLNANFKIEVDDPFKNKRAFNQDKKYQHIFSCFPLGLEGIFKQYNEEDNILPLTQKTSSDYHFINLTLKNLKRGGKAVVIIGEPALSSQRDIEMRKYLVENGLIEAIYTLPNNLFSNSAITMYIMTLSFNNKHIKMADLSDYYLNISKRKRVLDLDTIYLNQDKDLKSIEFSNLEKNDYILIPNRYLIDITFSKDTKILDEIAEIFTGWQITTKGLEERYNENGETSIIQITDIRNYQIHLNKKYNVESEYKEKYQLKKNDIIITAKSTKVEFAVIEDEKIAALPAGTLTVLRLKPGFNPYYIVSFFESEVGKNLIKLYQSGTVIKNLTPNNLKKIPIPILDLKTQDEIAKEFKETIAKINSLEKEAAILKDNLINNKHFI